MKITDVKVFHTQPIGPQARQTVVKVETDQDGLYGLGCATYTQRYKAVEAALVHHLGPFVIGKDPADIEDLWQSMNVHPYWRNGPVMNNAISGIDMALWDIKGKEAGLPCYQLWGGKSRYAVTPYVHANGKTIEEVAENVQKKVDQGFKNVRCQLGGYTGVDANGMGIEEFRGDAHYFDPKEKLIRIPKLFEYLRIEIGEEVGLLHDVHERLAPIDAVKLAKDLEPYNLFFLEDILAPEDQEWLTMIRAQCATPIAMGELFNHPLEMMPFISKRLIDFVRCHISQIGGISPALKLAHACEPFGVRTAWHCPGDVSPVGAAANVHLDMAVHNFGIQEWAFRNEAEHEIFPGIPEVKDGMIHPNDKPGLGIDFVEEEAVKYPPDEQDLDWTQARLSDGTIQKP